MTKQECNKDDLPNLDQSGWDHLKRNTLKATAPLFLITAIMSHWYVSYYAADYYAHAPKQQGLNLGTIKARVLGLGDLKILGFTLADVGNLIKFDYKK